MAVAKLNPSAPPFPLPTHHHYQFSLPPPHPVPGPAYHGTPLPPPFPVFPMYSCAPFAIPAQFQYPCPTQQPPAYPCMGFPMPPAYQYCKGVPTPAKASPPPPPPYCCEGVPFAPQPLPPPGICQVVPVPLKASPRPAEVFRNKHGAALLPHGSAPHKLILGWNAAAEQLQAQGAAVIAPPVEAAKGSTRKATLKACARGWRVGAQAGRGRARARQEYRPKQAEPARSPSPVITPPPPPTVPSRRWLGRLTTVMVCNIPSKLTRDGMMKLLDDHCARANKKHGAARSAYDFLYLPMDFSMCIGERTSNVGYAFVNLTTAAAARELYCALHGSRWKVFGSKKIIDIRDARIQGKKALMKHFSASTFVCGTDEFLPAVFSPPRDGAAEVPEPKNVGVRVTPRHLLQPPS